LDAKNRRKSKKTTTRGWFNTGLLFLGGSMKDMDYLKDRFKRVEDRLKLLESFITYMFRMEHQRSTEELRSKDGGNRD
jgi:hypothetical protein